MYTNFILIGILSVAYYLFIFYHTRKWNSTFAVFWIIFAAVNLMLAGIVKVSPVWLQYLLTTVAVAAGFVFFAVEVIICSAMLTVPPDGLEYLVILGAQVRGTKITDSLRRRLDRGIRYLRENPGTQVIVSGGQGRGETVTEAYAMACYLTEQGIEEERIFLEEQSENTFENLKYSAALVGNMDAKTGVVTNNFHVYRALLLGRQIGYTRLYGIAAGCNAVLFLNYMVREFFAIVKMYLIREK